MLELHIASQGGDADELIQIYNLANTVFHGRVATFANQAYSAGAWAFLFGRDRILYEHSSLMWHSYAGGFGGKRQDLLDQMEHDDRRLSKFLMGTLEPYFTKKELKRMNSGKDFWLDTEEACRRGMCTHVYVNGVLLDAEDYLNPPKPPKPPKRPKKKKVKKVKN